MQNLCYDFAENTLPNIITGIANLATPELMCEDGLYWCPQGTLTTEPPVEEETTAVVH